MSRSPFVWRGWVHLRGRVDVCCGWRSVFERGRENKERVWLSGYMRVSTCKKGGETIDGRDMKTKTYGRIE